jgi:hypothetical protein
MAAFTNKKAVLVAKGPDLPRLVQEAVVVFVFAPNLGIL